jgi:hypothetical protein
LQFPLTNVELHLFLPFPPHFPQFFFCRFGLLGHISGHCYVVSLYRPNAILAVTSAVQVSSPAFIIASDSLAHSGWMHRLKSLDWYDTLSSR